MAKKNNAPVKELTNYAIEYGKWLKDHEDENGKVLSKKLSKDDRLTKQLRDHYIEDNSAVLDNELEKSRSNKADLEEINSLKKQVEELKNSANSDEDEAIVSVQDLIDIRNKLFNEELNDGMKKFQREGIDTFLKALGIALGD